MLGLWAGVRPRPWVSVSAGGLSLATFVVTACQGRSEDAWTQVGVAFVVAVPAAFVAWGAHRPKLRRDVLGLGEVRPVSLLAAALGTILVAITASPTLASSWRGVPPWDLPVITLPRLVSPSGALWPLIAFAVGAACMKLASRRGTVKADRRVAHR